MHGCRNQRHLLQRVVPKTVAALLAGPSVGTCCGGDTAGAGGGMGTGSFMTCTASGRAARGLQAASAAAPAGRPAVRAGETSPAEPIFRAKPAMVDRPAEPCGASGEGCCSRGPPAKAVSAVMIPETAHAAYLHELWSNGWDRAVRAGACQSGGTCMGAMMGTGGTCVACGRAGPNLLRRWWTGDPATPGLACTGTASSERRRCCRSGGSATCQACGGSGEACCGQTCATVASFAPAAVCPVARTVANRAARKVSRAARLLALVAQEPAMRYWPARPQTVAVCAAVSERLVAP